jgi:hypothetical protein
MKGYKLVQFRRGTAAEWSSENPILSAGEMGYERDVPLTLGPSADTFDYTDPAFGSGAIKIGDGVTRWNDLPYLLNALRFSLPSSSDVEVTDIRTGDVLRWSSGKWRNYSETQLFDGGNF